jgi:hypothetical protein
MSFLASGTALHREMSAFQKALPGFEAAFLVSRCWICF